MKAMAFKPKFIAFCCNWCSYAAADLAGIARMQYPHNVRIIRVMCSGMVHPEYVLDALAQGADGVMIIGCHLGECHYLEGNYRALERSTMITELLEDFGYDPGRFELAWVSSAEPDKFTKAITAMTNRILSLGPNRSENDAYGSQTAE
jgi:F420-non-reducing hydrogenase iron-sulfur subunit